MTHVMIDIETMGTTSQAAIVSIGAVKFDPMQFGILGAEFYCLVDLNSCVKAGLDIDASTVMWWLAQEKAAQNALNEGSKLLIDEALKKLSDWFTGATYVWSHGAIFDVVILGNAYKAVKSYPSWEFRNVRDTRTLFALSGPVPKDDLPKIEGVKHHALYDAKVQALMVQWSYKQLGKA